MFEILQYLYDHYLADDRYPDTEALALKLSTAGFDQDEIDQALAWLDELAELDPERQGELAATGTRVYSQEEMERLDPEARGFLAFLENAGLLSPYAREWVIERALALKERQVPAQQLKWIALLALWRLDGPLSALWLEDLVRTGDEDPAPLH